MPATIIDFQPQALEIDQVASAAGAINPNVPPPLLPTVNRSISAATDRGLGNIFIANSPDILFTAEYAGTGEDSSGILVCWENFYNATHYELYKRVYTAQDDSWQRVLFLDQNTLGTETQRFVPYIEQKLQLGVSNVNNYYYYAILDTDVPSDRIVEYYVVAGYYPQSAQFNWDMILRSKGLLSTYNTTSGQTIFDVSKTQYGTTDYAWALSLANPGAPYFGKPAAQNAMSSFTGGGTVYVINDLSAIPKAFQESAHFFGLSQTINNMLTATKSNTEITTFYDRVVSSINNTTNSLSYSKLQSALSADYPTVARAISEVKSGNVKDPALFIAPTYADATSFQSLDDIAFMFVRLNTILIATLYAYDNSLALFAQSIVANLQGIQAAIGAAQTTQPTVAQTLQSSLSSVFKNLTKGTK